MFYRQSKSCEQYKSLYKNLSTVEEAIQQYTYSTLTL